MFSREFSFCFFISYAYIFTCIGRHLKESFPLSNITWSEMGKQNVQANALVSGKPRTPIPGECEALAGDFGCFGLSLLPRYAGFSTAFGASIGERGP